MNLYLLLYTNNRSTWSKETKAFFNALLSNVFTPDNFSQERVDAQMKCVLDLT
jgi:hypothetical protein